MATPPLPFAIPKPVSSTPAAPNPALCPQPLLNEWAFKPGNGYFGGRMCGNWTSAPDQRCCLPCPAQDWLYENADESFATSNVLAIISFVLCALLILSWIVLPADCTHRDHRSVGIISTLAIISLAFAIPSSSTQTRADPITPHSIYSSPLCGFTGILLQFGILAASLYTLFTTVHLHMRLVWSRSPGKSFMLLSLFTSTTVPIIVIGITIAMSGFAYGVGNVCLVEHENSAAVFYGWVVGMGAIALLVMAATAVMIKRKSGHRKPRGSLVFDGGPVVKTEVNIRDIVRQDVRHLLTAVLLPIELLLATSILWRVDRVLAHATDDERMRELVNCLIGDQGQAQICRDAAKGILPSESAVVAAFVILAILGLQTSLLHILRPRFLRTWLDVLQHPINTLKHRQYPQHGSTVHQQTPITMLSSSSTLADKDLAAGVLYKVDQPAGSLRQLRRPSLASRMRRESASNIMQLEDLHNTIPSPVREETSAVTTPHVGTPFTGAPFAGTPSGVNPYGYSQPHGEEVHPFQMPKFDMQPTAQGRRSDVAPWEEQERPVSPISPIDNPRQSWFRESLFSVGDGSSSRPVSPTTAPSAAPPAPMPGVFNSIATPAPVPHVAQPAPAVTPLRRTRTHAARIMIPDILRPGLRRHQTEDSPVSPRTRNASVAVHGSNRNGGGLGGNPLRMNAVEPFRSRRFSQA